MNIVTVATAAVISLSATLYGAAQGPAMVPAPASPMNVGHGSGKLVFSDLNRDGHLDLIAEHLLGQSLTVRLGDGKGHFASAAADPMKLSFQPGAIAVRDINGDGIPDLGVTARDEQHEYVHVYLGDGKGAFREVKGSPVTVSEAAKTYKPKIEFADVNEDGKLDFVTANGRRNTIEVFLGDGRGAFRPGPGLKLEADRDRYSFAVGDVDGDGHVDLVTGSNLKPDSPGEIATWRGDGRGGFREASRTPVRASAGFGLRALADVDGDGKPDVVLTQRNQLTVLTNDGRGRFTKPFGPAIDVGWPAYAVLVTDLNRDGKPDCLVATVDTDHKPFESRLVALTGTGRGLAPAPGSPFTAGLGAYTLALGDVDEDGKPDVAASSFEGDAATLLLGR